MGEFLNRNWRNHLISGYPGGAYGVPRKADGPHIDPDHACCLRALPPPVQGPRHKDLNKAMLSPSYDILKKDAAALVWVEAVNDLEAAKVRIQQLAARSEGEYVIFDQRTRQIVARINAPTHA